jgi:O-antigen/teichoic acid export membrane protein
MIFTQMLFLPSALTEAITAGLGHTYAESKKSFKKMYYLYEDIYVMITFSLLTVTFLLTTPFLILYTKNINDISYIDNWLPLLFYVKTILVSLRTSNLLPINVIGKFIETKNTAIVEALINLCISLLLVNSLGIKGVIIGSIVALLYRIVVISKYVNKEILFRNNIKQLKKLLINVIPMFAVIFIYFNFNISITSYTAFIIIGAILTITISIILLIVNLLTNKEFYSAIKLIYKAKRGD